MSQYRSKRPGAPCNRCGIFTTAIPVKGLRLCAECRRDRYYVLRASA